MKYLFILILILFTLPINSQSLSNPEVVMDTKPISVYLYSNQPNYPATYFVSAPDVPGYQCIGIECPLARDFYISRFMIYWTIS